MLKMKEAPTRKRTPGCYLRDPNQNWNVRISSSDSIWPLKFKVQKIILRNHMKNIKKRKKNPIFSNILVGGRSVNGKLTWYIPVKSDSTSKNQNDILLMVRLTVFVYFYLLCQLFTHMPKMSLNCMLHITMIKLLSYLMELLFLSDSFSFTYSSHT